MVRSYFGLYLYQIVSCGDWCSGDNLESFFFFYYFFFIITKHFVGTHQNWCDSIEYHIKDFGAKVLSNKIIRILLYVDLQLPPQYVLYTIFIVVQTGLSKQYRLRSDATFCGI